MNDCPKAELRDRLPDLLHERLDAFARAAVVSHLEDCALCREELELLRGLRGVLARGAVVQIDVTRIVRALPAPPVAKLATPVRRAWRFSDWRVAAAITVLLAAGTSVGTYLRIGGHQVISDSLTAQQPASFVDSQSTKEVLVAQVPSELYVGSGLNDLSDSELQSLVTDIENFDGLPASDPEAGLPVPLRASEGL